MGITRDRRTFDEKIREARRNRLKEFIRTGKIEGRKKGKKIVFPVPILDLPRFKYGQKQKGGEGEGEGEGEQSEPGDQEGDHIIEEVSLEELAEMMAEELELPNIQPKGNNRIVQYDDVLRSISKVGSPGRLDKRRSFKKALKRNLVQGGVGRGTLDATIKGFKDRIVVAPRDRRYRSFKTVTKPEMNAVVIYMMDVSGSMGEKQKDLVRRASFWIDLWLNHQYDGLESRFIIHDAKAKIVDKYTFFHTKESGGTLISTAYEKAKGLIHSAYPHDQWNIYLLQFSDGDNWSGNDTDKTFEIIDELLPIVNMVGYTQVESDFGSGRFLKDVLKKYGEGHNKVITAEIEDETQVMTAIKTLLGKGN